MARLKNHVQVTLNELENSLTSFKIENYIMRCEERFDLQALGIAGKVSDDRRIRAVFVSGPTASGKTTFTHKLSDYLNQKNIPTVTISIDDYYYFREYVTDEYGRPDFESLDILDIKLMLDNLSDLFKGKRVKIPSFDFIIKDRVAERAKDVYLPEDGVVLVEGLHGLSNLVSGAIPADEWIGVFIMPYATLTDDRKLLDMRDIRILRRVSRDAFHRGAKALATIDYWPMLDIAEGIHFPEYLKNADVYINSIMPYEFYCVAPLAHSLIGKSILDYENNVFIDSNLTHHRGLAQPEIAIREAKRLFDATGRIPQIDLNLVPETSIINEFIR